MTEISFHFNVPDPMLYTCRIVRKALRSGARPVVTAAAETLARLDRQLWAFDAVAFVPHVWLRPGAADADRMHATPVWLVEQPGSVDRHDVLVNLGEGLPIGFESYSKLIEVVSTSAADRSAARLRWKHYKERGYAIVDHAVSE